MKQKIIQSGNSAAVVVPASFTKAVGVKIGDEVDVCSDPSRGEVIYRFTGIKQLSINSSLTKRRRR